MAIYCHTVKQHIANGFFYDGLAMKSREILAKNLRLLMQNSAKYKNRPSLAAAAGLSARTIGYMRQKTGGNPTLKNIEAVAEIFDLEVWELLIDHAQAKKRLLSKIFDVSAPDPVETDVIGQSHRGKYQ